MKTKTPETRRKQIAATFVVVVATIGLGHVVTAHDEIASSDPENQSQFDDPISEVTVDFGVVVEGIELALLDPDDREIPGTVVTLTDTSARLDFETLAREGQYIVQYLAVENGHVVAGAFSFVYGSESSPGAGALTWILLGAVTVVILAIGAFFSLRRSRELNDELAV